MNRQRPPGFPYPSDPLEPPCWAGCQLTPPGIVGDGAWAPAYPYPSDPLEPPCWAGCQLTPPGIVGQGEGLWPLPPAPPVDISFGEHKTTQESVLKTIMVAALPTILAGVTVYYLTREKKKDKELPNPIAGKATFTGWMSTQGPVEFSDYLVVHATYVPYSDFAKHVDVSTFGFDQPGKDRLIAWLRTRLPSGKEAWIAMRKAHTYLAVNGYYDHGSEVRLAHRWAVTEGMPTSRKR